MMNNINYRFESDFFSQFLKNSQMVKTMLWCVLKYADVAQLAAQLTCNEKVVGSSPTFGSSPVLGVLRISYPYGRETQTLNLMAECPLNGVRHSE